MDSECPAAGLQGNSCALSEAELGERDALSAVRMLVSLLSILGTSAVITSIIKNRLIWSPTIHPIFQLSVADWLQGLLWIIGACLWFRGTSNRVGCYIVSIFTVILECVAANLTLVYAILAYSTLNKNFKRNAMDTVYSSSAQVWHPVKSVLVYLTAWILPVVIIVPVFSSLMATTELWEDTHDCTCWCFPHVGNVLPLSPGRDLPSATYLWHVRKLLVAYGALLLLNYLIVFILMAILYHKILQTMKKIKETVAEFHNDVMNQTVRNTQGKARQRITHFLLVFLIMALSTVILSVVVLVYSGHALHKGVTVVPTSSGLYSYSAEQDLFLHLFQSLTVPLQGFLNAIVYGRTREDFVHMMESTARFFAKSGAGRAEMHLAHDIVSDGDENTEEPQEGSEEKAMLYSGSFSGSPSPLDTD